MKKILIIGASGFIGQKLLRSLQNYSELQITTISQRQLTGVATSSDENILMDISNISLFQTVPFEEFDVIIHLATIFPCNQRPRSNLFTVNTSTVSTIIDRIVDSKAHYRTVFIFFSAMSIFRGTQDLIITHNTQPTSVTEYDLSKIAAEKCLQSLRNSVVLRIPLLLEPGATRSWLTNSVQSLILNEDVFISNPSALYNHIIDFDCILGCILLLIQKGPSFSSTIQYPINLASSDPMSIFDMMTLMKLSTNSSSKILQLEDHDSLPKPPLISIDYARSLGLSPKSTHQIVSNFVNSISDLPNYCF